MAEVKYHFALDEHNRTIDIKQAYIERNEGHSFRCIGCGAEMIARLGVVRNWHFAHKKEEDCCIIKLLYVIHAVSANNRQLGGACTSPTHT